MADCLGCFTWYELITTDVAAAKTFYTDVVGWGAHETSTVDLSYVLFTVGEADIGGLMDLPEKARKMGATPRWMGYVSVDDIDVTADRIRRLGGTVFVPPTKSNIGRISVVADPQTATLALVKGLEFVGQRPADLAKPGRVGWHELFATDQDKAFAFYNELFGWQKTDAEIDPIDPYQLFSARGQTMGGIFTKHREDPVPFWLFYFNVGDIDAAVQRVKVGGGEVFKGIVEVPGGGWIARCRDPQGAAFALQGKRSQNGFGWSAEWSEFSSRGRLLSKQRG